MSDNGDKKVEIDDLSGIETTGHEWDGLKELNNPLPRWWVWIFIITVFWSIWYWVAYPAWPTLSGSTQGSKGYTQYIELNESQAEIFARQETYLNKFKNASFEEILNTDELYSFAMAGGASAFKDNCATCHGSGAEGGKGYPNLNDDDWLWGGKLKDIHKTLLYGIRANNIDTHQSIMPAFGKEKILEKHQIHTVVEYVISLSNEENEGYSPEGELLFKEHCASCHGTNGKGLKEFGAPNLTDKIWLYGGDKNSVFNTVYNSRAGMMPAWQDRLDKETIRQLAIYIHQLGGGTMETEYVPDQTNIRE